MEQPAPAVLPGEEFVVLTEYGSVFFASSQVVEAQLPRVEPESTGALAELGPDNVFPATARVGQSLTSALEQARALRS